MDHLADSLSEKVTLLMKSTNGYAKKIATMKR